ncbi:hypothetical protein TNCV_376181 [Trichonephila clavipes]|nr:hypothetical protein TNCV_376181 [Trichonephila clavipes]
MGTEVHEQLSRSGGESEAILTVFNSPSKLGTHLSTHCRRSRKISISAERRGRADRKTNQEINSGRPRGTTPADDRYIVLQARRNRRQTAGEIDRHTTPATGRPISRFTVARRLHGGGLFARSVCTVCTFNACPSEKAFSVVPGTPELERQ